VEVREAAALEIGHGFGTEHAFHTDPDIPDFSRLLGHAVELDEDECVGRDPLRQPRRDLPAVKGSVVEQRL